jgi:hypothetical protein
MDQIGSPITSLTQGVSMVALFSSLTAGLAYKAYSDGDQYAGFSSIGCLIIAGLSLNNTLAYMLAGEESFGQSPDVM